MSFNNYNYNREVRGWKERTSGILMQELQVATVFKLSYNHSLCSFHVKGCGFLRMNHRGLDNCPGFNDGVFYVQVKGVGLFKL